MAEDLYSKWLGIPAGHRPPDHYALLGVPLLSNDVDAVEAATRARMDKLDSYALHPDHAMREAVQRMMNEVARARVCLVNQALKRAYDADFARRHGLALPEEAEPAEEPPLAEILAAVPEATPRQQFEQRLRAHLKKWVLNPQEETLLLAEAASLGIDPKQARQIVRRVDAESERAAKTASRRWTYAVLGIAVIIPVIGALVCLAPGWTEARRQQRFERDMDAARSHLAGGDYRGAASHLADAEKIRPDDPVVSQVRIEVGRRMRAQVEQDMRARLEDARRRSEDGRDFPSRMPNRTDLDNRLRPLERRPFPPVTPSPSATAVPAPLAPAAGKEASPWANARPGMTLTYRLRLAPTPGGRDMHDTLRVLEVTGESVIILETTDPDGQPGGMQDELCWPRQASPNFLRRLTGSLTPLDSQTLIAAGRSLTCQVYSYAAPGGRTVRLFLSRDVPGWVVRAETAMPRGRPEAFMELTGWDDRGTARPPFGPRPPSYRPSYGPRYGPGRLRGYGPLAAHRRIWTPGSGYTAQAPRNLAITPDGNRLLTLAGQRVRVWDTNTGRLVNVLPLAVPNARTLLLDPSGRYLLIGGSGQDSAAACLEWGTGKPLGRIDHVSGLADLTWCRNGQAFLAACSQGVLLWEASSNSVTNLGGKGPIRVAMSLSPVASVSAAPDGRYAAGVLRNGTVAVYDLAERKQVRTLSQREAPLIRANVCTDGVRIATIDLDGAGSLWDAPSGKRLSRIAEMNALAVSFSPDGSRLVMAETGGGAMALYDAASGSQLAMLWETPPTSSPLVPAFAADPTPELPSALFLPDGTAFLADCKEAPPNAAPPGHSSLANKLGLFDAATGQRRRERRAVGRLRSMMLVGNGDSAVRASGAGAWDLIDLNTGRVRSRFTSHLESVRRLIVVGQTALTATDRQVRLWDLKTGKETGRYDGMVLGDTSPAGDRVVLRSSNDSDARVLELQTGTSCALEVASAYSLHFTGDGKYIVDKQHSFRGLPAIVEAATGRSVALPLLKPNQRLRGATFSHDGLALAGQVDNCVYVCDLAAWRGQLLGTLMGRRKSLGNIAFSPDRQWMVGVLDRDVVAWQVWGGQARVFQPPAQPDRSQAHIRGLLVAPDNATAVIVYATRIELLDLKTGSVQSAETPAGSVYFDLDKFKYSPDGKALLFSEYSRPILWRADTGKLVPLKAPPASYTSPQGARFVLGGKGILARTHRGPVLWDTASGDMTVLKLPAGTLSINDLAVSPDGRHCAAWVRNLALWELQGVRCWIVDLPDKTSFVGSVKFDPKGVFLMASGPRVTAIVDIKTRQVTAELATQAPAGEGALFSDDLQTWMEMLPDGTAQLREVPTGKPIVRLIQKEIEPFLRP